MAETVNKTKTSAENQEQNEFKVEKAFEDLEMIIEKL